MQANESIPKDAAAVILLRDDSNEVYLAQRNPKISFLGGYHAFPGGKVDAGDSEIEVRNCEDKDLAKFIVCAVRETFEEVGVLLVRGGDKITKGQRASLRDDLISGRFSFAEILETWGLRIDAEDFQYTGFWTTPKFSPVRFKTRFFLAVCPHRQEPQTFGEFISGEFLAPNDALKLWENSQVLISPPVLITIQHLAQIEIQNLRSTGEKLLAASQITDGEIRYIKLNPFVTVFPVRTETLPPATHTNCFIVGEKEFVVIDPGSPFIEEQQALNYYLDSLIAAGHCLREIILTHLHKDHVSGAVALQKHFQLKHGLSIPIAMHSATAQSLKGLIKAYRFIADEEIFQLKTSNENVFEIKAFHTPGHARGHLCFYDEKAGFLLSGDNVIGAGSVLIAPPEGNMTEYLVSLERMRSLPNLRFLCGSHGAAIFNAREKIESYIAHRLEREAKILRAIEEGAKTTREIVERAYSDVSPELWSLAEKSVEAHLEKIEMEKNSLVV